MFSRIKSLLNAFVVLVLVGILVMFSGTLNAYAAASNVVDGQQNLLAAFDSAGVVVLVVGTLLPALVGLVSQQRWNAGVKGAIHLALSALIAFGSQYLNARNSHVPFLWEAAALTTLLTFVSGLLSHNYVLKPLGVSAALQAVGSSTNTNGQYVTTLTEPDIVLADDHDLSK